MKVLRANLASGEVGYEEIPDSWKPYGGRALVARFLLDEVPPTCYPLGPFNKLIWAPGLLVGHMLSSVDRISVGGKSPLTGGVKEANAGGTTGMRMAWLRLFALIIEGGPPADGSWQVLIVDDQGARLEDAADLVGLGLKVTAKALICKAEDTKVRLISKARILQITVKSMPEQTTVPADLIEILPSATRTRLHNGSLSALHIRHVKN